MRRSSGRAAPRSPRFRRRAGCATSRRYLDQRTTAPLTRGDRRERRRRLVCAGWVLAYDAAVEERAACAHLKRRFEAAGFRIKENQTFNEHGVWFEMDGFDAERRVGYEYVTEEAGDGWDVDGDVIAALADRRRRGEIHVLIIDEEDAPDAASLDHAIDEFLAGLPPRAAEAPAAPAEAHADEPTSKMDAPPAAAE